MNNIDLKYYGDLKINSHKLGICRFENFFQDDLEYYIKLGNTTDLDSLKNHIEIMLNSVDRDDNINFKMFTDQLIELKIEITEFLKNKNIKVVDHNSILKFTSILDFFSDIDNIKKVAIILFYLIPLVLILYYWLSGELTSKSLIELIFKR